MIAKLQKLKNLTLTLTLTLLSIFLVAHLWRVLMMGALTCVEPEHDVAVEIFRSQHRK